MNEHIITSSNNLYSGKISVRSDKYQLGDKTIEKEIVEHPDTVGIIALDRSEERRVGKECRSRWSPYH